MIAAILLDLGVNGTVAWSVTGVNDTTANLNVTSSLTMVNLNPTALPPLTFQESVDLATRLVSFQSSLSQNEDSLSAAWSSMQSSLPVGVNLSSLVSTMTGLQGHVYTMWWVNGPLAQAQRVPVLAFPSLPVLRQETVDLGELGSRTAWIVGIQSMSTLIPPVSTSLMPGVPMNATVQLLFYYDSQSDLLLKSTASLQLTSPASSTPYLGTSLTATISLALSSTSLNLDQRLLPATTVSPGQTSGSGPGPGTGQGTGSGTNGDSGLNGHSSAPTGSQPGSNPGGTIASSTSPTLPGAWPWVYALAGLTAATITSLIFWVARRRRGPGLVTS